MIIFCGCAVIIALLVWSWTEDDPVTPPAAQETPIRSEPHLTAKHSTQDGQANIPSPPQATDIELRASARERVVRGQVLDVDMRPVTGGEIVIRARDGTDLREVERTGVDAEGGFSLFNREALRRVIASYSGPSHFLDQCPLDLYEGRSLQLVVEKLHSIHVTVVDQTGKGVPDARVHGNRRPVLGDAGDSITDADGECELVVGPGAMRIMARTEGDSYGSIAPVVVPGQDRVVVRLDRELADVQARVVPEAGNEHLLGRSVTLVPRHGIVPIRRVGATIGGEPVVLPLKYVDVPARSGASARNRRKGLRSVGALVVELDAEVAYPVSISWSSFEKARAGEVLVLQVEDPRHRVTLKLTDSSGNPVRGYSFRLTRLRQNRGVHGVTTKPRTLRVRSDHDGLASFLCANGTYQGPFPGPLVISGPTSQIIRVGVTTVYGTATPWGGEVRVVPRGKEKAGRGEFPRAPIEGGRWYLNIPGVVPGTELVAQWMDRSFPLASADAEAGGGPVHLDVEAVSRDPHETTLRVTDRDRIVWCRVRLDTQKTRDPRIQRKFEGLQIFDLSAMPPGQYAVEVTTRDQRQHFFKSPLSVGTGEALTVDLQDATRIWDGRNGGWIER